VSRIYIYDLTKNLIIYITFFRKLAFHRHPTTYVRESTSVSLVLFRVRTLVQLIACILFYSCSLGVTTWAISHPQSLISRLWQWRQRIINTVEIPCNLYALAGAPGRAQPTAKRL